jgi:hypothetical protein
VRVGVALADDHVPDVLIRRAAAAMYEAKRLGGEVVLFDEGLPARPFAAASLGAGITPSV